MNQLGLFDRPRARRSDPLSSHEAVDRAARFIGKQAEAVLQLVLSRPGSTTKELGAVGPLDRFQVARRVPELEAHGYVTRTEAREGAELRVWPTEKSRRWAEGSA